MVMPLVPSNSSRLEQIKNVSTREGGKVWRKDQMWLVGLSDWLDLGRREWNGPACSSLSHAKYQIKGGRPMERIPVYA